MLSCQKDLFSIPEDITYLNCAYMGPLPKVVEQAGIEALSVKAQPYNVQPIDFFTSADKLRSQFAGLIHINDPQSIALVPSVSYGFANVIKNCRPSGSQNIILVEEIFPSNYYSWKRLADDTGAELRLIKAPTLGAGRGRLWNEAVMNAIDESTFAVSLPQVHWVDGTWFDLEAVRNRTNEVGAMLVIDGSQFIGAMPFDLNIIRPDALITVGYKWMFGAYGFGFAYYNERFGNGAPVEENWINRLGSENFQGLVNYQPAYKPGNQRYNVGEYSSFIAVAMLNKSLEMIVNWGVENIQQYCRHISQNFLSELSERGCTIEENAFRASHLFGVRLAHGIDMEKLKKEASDANVFVSVRGNAIRISPHVYNSAEDFQKLLKVFDRVL